MARTAQLRLPLVLPAQAQKHVTVNEALARLDALAQLRVLSRTVETPPVDVADGSSFIVPAGATDDWQGRDGDLAIRSNGGWVFVRPKDGWRAWDASSARNVSFDGTGWVDDASTISSNGAATLQRILEIEHVVTPGSSNQTQIGIPDRAQVLGVTGRVVQPLTGIGLTGWQVGVAGSENRYGSGLGLELNSYLVGMSGTPVTYYGETPLLITGEGGQMTSGIIRFALHISELVPPRAV